MHRFSDMSSYTLTVERLSYAKNCIEFMIKRSAGELNRNNLPESFGATWMIALSSRPFKLCISIFPISSQREDAQRRLIKIYQGTPEQAERS